MVSLPSDKTHLGRYEIRGPLGRGGMAVVYKCFDPTLGREVAVKVIPAFQPGDPTFTERFTQEARTVASLNHPNILQIYDFGEDQGFIYIVSELLTGGTLQEKLRGQLALEDAFKFLRPLAEALDHAHANGIIHRDIKPTNVLIDSESNPILADFGLSRVMQQAYRMTNPNEIMGTPEYISPEQALGENTDSRSDLYSFGILAYQILVGQTPFRADTAVGTMMAHVHQEMTFPDGSRITITDPTRAVLKKATAKKPEDRYESATEMVDALAGAAFQSTTIRTEEIGETVVVVPTVAVEVNDSAGLVVEDVSVAVPEVPSRFLGKRSLIIALSSVVVLVVVAVSVTLNFVLPDDSVPDNEFPDLPAVVAQAPLPTSETSVEVVAVSTSIPIPVAPQEELSLADAIKIADAVKARTFGIQANVNQIRNLYPDDDIQTKFSNNEELETLADTFFRRGDLRDQVFQSEELFKALGLLDEGDDLENITRDVLLQQVSALFDDQSGYLYVLSDSSEIGLREELAYASVYMAGLQDQIFDISGIRGRARRSNFDEFRAVTAFASGDVFQITQGYVDVYFGGQAPETPDRSQRENVLTNSRNVIRSTVTFPQFEGGNFVAELFASSGNWDAVDAAYDQPPVSTEQVIHPDKYLAGETPVETELPDIRDALGSGWSEQSANVMGEFLLRTYLEEHLEFEMASSAAEGWGGDRYTLLLGPSGESVFTLLIDWDTQDDAAEFFGAYRQYADAMTKGMTVSRIQRDSQQWWVTPDRTTYLQDNASSTLLIIADDESLVRQVISAFPTP